LGKDSGEPRAFTFMAVDLWFSAVGPRSVFRGRGDPTVGWRAQLAAGGTSVDLRGCASRIELVHIGDFPFADQGKVSSQFVSIAILMRRQ